MTFITLMTLMETLAFSTRAFSKRAFFYEGFFHEGFFYEGFFHEGFTRRLYTRSLHEVFFPRYTRGLRDRRGPSEAPEAHETHEAHGALWWCHPSIKDRLQSSSIPQNLCQCLIRYPLLHSHKKEAFCVQQKRKLKCPHFRTKLRVPLFLTFFLFKDSRTS